MIGIVIVTHGRLAEEMRLALEHVVGPQPQLRAVCIGPDDDSTCRCRDVEESIRSVDTGDGAILLTDMFGGTPSNLCIAQMARPGVEVLGGVNLPMLVKLAKVRGLMPLAEAVQMAQMAGRKYIAAASEVLPHCREQQFAHGPAAAFPALTPAMAHVPAASIGSRGSDPSLTSAHLMNGRGQGALNGGLRPERHAWTRPTRPTDRSLDAGARSRTVTIVNRRGLHARAAAKLASLAERFAARTEVLRDGQAVSASSIMGLMMLGAGQGTTIEIVAEGGDAEAALAALAALVESGFDEQG